MISWLAAYDPVNALILALAGVVIGAMGGMLGIGGGVVAVPVLLEVFGADGLAPQAALPLSIGTAHLVVALAALPAAWGHARAGTLELSILRGWTPAILAGGVIGLALAPWLPPALSVSLFALILVLLALRMGVGGGWVLAPLPPPPPAGHLPPLLLGGLAAALGIGAGTLSGPVLGLFGVALRRAAGAGAVFNLAVSAPATLVFALAPRAATPDAVGQVALGAAALLSVPAMLAAPIAARCAGKLPEVVLRRLFALSLSAIALRVLLR
ncbi:TSUP family transporter [Roseomonas sp. F4]